MEMMLNAINNWFTLDWMYFGWQKYKSPFIRCYITISYTKHIRNYILTMFVTDLYFKVSILLIPYFIKPPADSLSLKNCSPGTNTRLITEGFQLPRWHEVGSSQQEADYSLLRMEVVFQLRKDQGIQTITSLRRRRTSWQRTPAARQNNTGNVHTHTIGKENKLWS